MAGAILRLFRVAIGYAIACLAGLGTLIVAVPASSLFAPPPFATPVDILSRAATLAGLVFDAPVATAGALALAAAVIAEVARLRSWQVHVLSWGGAGALAAASSAWLWHPGAPSGIGREVLLAFLAAGFVAGFAYWLIAGRTV